MFDPELFGQAMGEAIKKAVAPLYAKIAELEKQLADRPDVAALVADEVSKAVSSIPTPKDGKDADMAAVRALVDEAVKAIPPARDGKDADPAVIKSMVAEAVAVLPKPQDGKSVTVEDVRPLLDEAIKQLRADADQAIAEPLQQAEAARDALFKAVGELRQPEDGKSITLDDVQPVIKESVVRIELDAKAAIEQVGEAIKRVEAMAASIKQPEDGKSVTLDDVRPVIDEAIKGMQVQVNAAVEKVHADTDELRDAAKKAVEAIELPQDGKSVTVDDVAPMIRAEIEKAVSTITKPADGVGLAGAMIDRDDCLLVTLTNGEVKNLGRVVGKDGEDGLSLDALDVEYLPDTHEISIKASCAGKTKELCYPAGGIQPGGYWRDGTKAKACEAWTLDGQMYVAKRDTSSRPGYENRDDWTLFVRKGRDGESTIKRVKDGPEPPIKLGDPEGDK